MKSKHFQLVAIIIIIGSLVIPGGSSLAAPHATASALSNAPGSLDPSFGIDGKVITDFGNSDESGQAIVLQPDGKIIVAGFGSDDTNAGFALVRYNSDGSLDVAFGTNGKITAFNGDGAAAEAVALQPDGKIVVAGYGLAGFVVARFNSDGSLDTGFGTEGRATTNFDPTLPYYDYAHSMALQPDGRIIVAGATQVGDGTLAHSDFALARFNSDGSLDTTFDGDGKLTTDFGASDTGFSIALQPDGKIVMAGSSWDTVYNQFALARYNSDGSLDTSFDGDGKLLSDLGSSALAFAVALQSDGRIVVAGNTDESTPSRDFVLARYNSNGSLDTTFSGDGKVLTDFGRHEDARAVAIQSNGRIIVSGTSGLGYCPDSALARYNSNGSLDTSLDGDGKVTTLNDSALGIALQSDGRIVTAGGTSNRLNSDFAVTRYNTNGALDTSFYGSGKVITDFGGGDGLGYAYAAALQPDGKIVVAGIHRRAGNMGVNFAVARYAGDGSLDPTFDTDGKVTTDFGINEHEVGFTNSAQAVAVQPDGKIVVGGSSMNGARDSQAALVRYNTNGSLDTSFGSDGKVTTVFGPEGEILAIAVQPDGKILAAGHNGNPSEHYCCSSFVLARYNANGSLDTTFAGDGVVVTAFGGFATNPSQSLDKVQSMVIQPDGKVLVAGFNYKGSSSDFALARYNVNGSLDATFSGDGKVTTAFSGAGSYSAGYDVVLQPDGKIVVAGYTRNETNLFSDFALARYNADGSPDITFDGDGMVTTGFDTNTEDLVWALALQPDGKLVVSGRSNGNFALARYQSNGALDTSFDGDGRVTTDFGGNYGGDMVLQPDGGIVVAGSLWNNDSEDFLLARFLGEQGTVVHHVKHDAGGLNDGTSWENAYQDLQSALGAASSGDEIWVAAGTYKPTTGVDPTDTDRTVSFTLKNGVAIYGGFAGTETLRTQRDFETNVTVLSGDIGVVSNNIDNSYHVVVGGGTNNTAVLDGFTITAGRVDGDSPDWSGGGLYNLSSSPVLANLTFTGNTAVMGGGGGIYNSFSHPVLTDITFSGNQAGNLGGGGIYNDNSNPSLTRVSFINNSATAGGGMTNYQSDPILIDVIFTGNTGASYAGGMYNWGSSPSLRNVVFSGNSGSSEGGGMFNYDNSKPQLVNVTFNNNSANRGGGMTNATSSPILINVTFANNSASFGGGMFSRGSGVPSSNSNPTIRNSIFWGNNGGEITNISSANPVVSYSIIQDGYAGSGNLNADPLLGGLQDNGGFTQTMALDDDSPAIDAGDTTNCPEADQRGVTRPQGAACDIGAYEYVDTILPTVLNAQRADSDPTSAAIVHFTVTFSEPVTGVDADDFVLATSSVTGAMITGVSGSDTNYTVTVNTGVAGLSDGTIQLNVVDNDSIRDAFNNPLGGLGEGNGNFDTGEFYTIPARATNLSAPVLISLRRNQITGDSTPEFSWRIVTNAVHYEIVFATDSAFSQDVEAHFTTGASFPMTVSMDEGRHYWRVRAYNDLGQPGPWSALRYFTIDTSAPPPPESTFPADGTVLRGAPTFRWKAVSGAVMYELEVDHEDTFLSPLVYSIVQRMTYRRLPGGLRGTYYWRVRARDAAGNWGPWSPVSSINILPPR